MNSSLSSLTRKLRASIFPVLVAIGTHSLFGADAELTNYKSGIDVTWGGTKGADYYEEYFYSDKLKDDHKVVYLKSTTPIVMSHNARNIAYYPSSLGNRQIIGANGKDGIANNGDEGIIRYKLDRDRQTLFKWSDSWDYKQTANLLPAYSAPFTLASQTYADSGLPVVGTTGGNGAAITNRSAFYYRGILDTVGDEWHVLSYADDSSAFLRKTTPATDDLSYADDGKTVLLVVNPKTPCFTARVTGTGQFFTTAPKAYWTPRIAPQTTYIAPGGSGTVTIELRDINGNNVFYRINGGSFINAGSSSVTLNDSAFAAGSNTLDYYYAGNSAYTKTRTVVKNPDYPSASETHGNYLFVDSANYTSMLSRLTRTPYSTLYNVWKTRSDTSGHDGWDAGSDRGLRAGGGNGGSATLLNAFVAKVEGFNYKRSGASKSFGQYAKAMLLDSSLTMDSLGFEMSPTWDAIPNKEVFYRGYYDARPPMDGIFAYDIMIANYKASQVSGGITEIEDHFLREHFAKFVYEAMLWSADVNVMGAPGMWGGARMIASTIMAVIMPEYSSSVYGTSGFGTVQTTYPLCPYQNDRLTWKQALYDGAAPKSAYPNLTWYTGITDNGSGNSLITAPSYTVGGVTFPEGSWADKLDYFTPSQMLDYIELWAHVTQPLAGGSGKARVNMCLNYAASGTLLGTKVNSGYTLAGQTPSRRALVKLVNNRWPNIAAANVAWVQALPDNDFNSDNTNMDAYAMALYDDKAGTSVPVGALAPNNAKIQVNVSP